MEVKITLEGEPSIILNTDASGEVLFASVKPGSYVCKIFKNGYVTQTITKVVGVGVNARVDVLFEAGVTP